MQSVKQKWCHFPDSKAVMAKKQNLQLLIVEPCFVVDAAEVGGVQGLQCIEPGRCRILSRPTF